MAGILKHRTQMITRERWNLGNWSRHTLSGLLAPGPPSHFSKPLKLTLPTLPSTLLALRSRCNRETRDTARQDIGDIISKHRVLGI
jgi:hypothetical protein